MEFVIVGIGFEVRDDLLPVGSEDVFVGAMQALIDLLQSASDQQRRRTPYICPRAGIEFGDWHISLSRELCLHQQIPNDWIDVDVLLHWHLSRGHVSGSQ